MMGIILLLFNVSDSLYWVDTLYDFNGTVIYADINKLYATSFIPSSNLTIDTLGIGPLYCYDPTATETVFVEIWSDNANEPGSKLIVFDSIPFNEMSQAYLFRYATGSYAVTGDTKYWVISKSAGQCAVQALEGKGGGISQNSKNPFGSYPIQSNSTNGGTSWTTYTKRSWQLRVKATATTVLDYSGGVYSAYAFPLSDTLFMRVKPTDTTYRFSSLLEVLYMYAGNTKPMHYLLFSGSASGPNTYIAEVCSIPYTAGSQAYEWRTATMMATQPTLEPDSIYYLGAVLGSGDGDGWAYRRIDMGSSTANAGDLPTWGYYRWKDRVFKKGWVEVKAVADEYLPSGYQGQVIIIGTGN